MRFLAGFVAWLAVVIFLSKRIPHWLSVTQHGAAISLLVFPVTLVAPVAGELIGRWQFNRLCEREAVVTLSPAWEKVKRAGKRDFPIVPLDGYLIRILSQRMKYFDIDTGKIFFTKQAFHADGGFLAYQMEPGLGVSTACWPNDRIQVSNKLNSEQLLKLEELK